MAIAPVPPPGGFEALHSHLQPSQLAKDGQGRRVAIGAAGDLLQVLRRRWKNMEIPRPIGWPPFELGKTCTFGNVTYFYHLFGLFGGSIHIAKNGMVSGKIITRNC